METDQDIGFADDGLADDGLREPISAKPLPLCVSAVKVRSIHRRERENGEFTQRKNPQIRYSLIR